MRFFFYTFPAAHKALAFDQALHLGWHPRPNPKESSTPKVSLINYDPNEIDIIYTIYIYIYLYLFISLSLSTYLPIHLSIHLSTYLYLSIYLPIYLSIFLSIYVCVQILNSCLGKELSASEESSSPGQQMWAATTYLEWQCRGIMNMHLARTLQLTIPDLKV